jgi:hypothetical protein
VYKLLAGKPEGLEIACTLQQRWQDYNAVDLKETVSGSVEWIELTQGRDK